MAQRLNAPESALALFKTEDKTNDKYKENHQYLKAWNAQCSYC